MLGNGRLEAGEITVTLNADEKITLKPTMRHAFTISRRFEGLSNAREKLVAQDLDAVVFIIRIGSGMTDAKAKNLEDRVWRNGVDIDLLVPLIQYVAILNNGGRPVPSMMDGDFDIVTVDQDQIEDHTEGNA